jgi:hypothetical protein
LINNQKTAQTYPVNVRLSENYVLNGDNAKLRAMSNKAKDDISLKIDPVKQSLDFTKLYFGREWREEEKKMLLTVGHVGKQIWLDFNNTHIKIPALVSVDAVTKTISAMAVNNIILPKKVAGHTFTEEDKDKLLEGKVIYADDFEFKKYPNQKKQSFLRYDANEGKLVFVKPELKKELGISSEEQKKMLKGEIINVKLTNDKGTIFDSRVRFNNDKGKVEVAVDGKDFTDTIKASLTMVKNSITQKNTASVSKVDSTLEKQEKIKQFYKKVNQNKPF